jgi:tetratricopeptide (TPR) repeat protein
MINGAEEGLKILRRSESVHYDPWIQSAELAASMAANLSPTASKPMAKRLVNSGKSSVAVSELAAGWITREALIRPLNKRLTGLLKSVVSDPTENALAQSIWLTDHLGDDFSEKFPAVVPDKSAHEARALLFAEQGKYNQAIQEGKRWQIDQPFQVRSFQFVGHTLYTYLAKPKEAIDEVRLGLKFHPKSWELRNMLTICLADVGELSEATEELRNLERVADDEYSKAFVPAAKGMLLIRSGKPAEGIKEYLDVLKRCKINDYKSLVFNAVIWLAENLSWACLIDDEALDRIFGLLTRRLDAVGKHRRRDLERLMRAREYVCRLHLARCEPILAFDGTTESLPLNSLWRELDR